MEQKENQGRILMISSNHVRTAHIISRDHQLVCSLNRILYLNGYSCVFSCSSDSATSNLRLLKADLIIIDHDLKEEMMNNALHHVKTLHPAANLIMIASQSLDDFDRRELAVLPQYVFIKPLKMDMVHLVIRRLTHNLSTVIAPRNGSPATINNSEKHVLRNHD